MLVRSGSVSPAGPNAGMPPRPARTTAMMAALSGLRSVKAWPYSAGPMPAAAFGWQALHFAWKTVWPAAGSPDPDAATAWGLAFSAPTAAGFGTGDAAAASGATG